MSYKCGHPGCSVIVQMAGEMCRPHEKMAKVKKIFFYAGTKLLDPLRDGTNEFAYRRNVFTFMSHVGFLLNQGDFIDERPWELCVNTTEGDSRENPKRKFKYFKPKYSFGLAGNLVTYNAAYVDENLGNPVPLGGVFEKELTAGALRTSPATWKECSEHNVRLTDGKCPTCEGPPPNEVTKVPKVDLSDSLSMGNSSGRCLKSGLDALEEWLEKEIAQDDCVFAVCDCNCFHNSAYLFGRLALRRRVKQEEERKKKAPVQKGHEQVINNPVASPVLILNIDQHQDKGKILKNKEEQLANSDGWGNPLLSNFSCGAYVVIGSMGAKVKKQLEISVKKPDSGCNDFYAPDEFCVLASDLKWNSNTRILNDADRLKKRLNQLWVFLEKKVTTEGTPFKYCYITIDRDCMVNSHTQWGHGKSVFWNASHVLAVADLMAKSLWELGIEVTGLDVTGLPEAPDVIKQGLSPAAMAFSDTDTTLCKEGNEKCKTLSPACCDKCQKSIMRGLAQEIPALYKKFKHWTRNLPIESKVKENRDNSCKVIEGMLSKYQCEFCSTKFQNQQVLYVHGQKCDKNPENTTCEYCKNIFESIREKQDHESECPVKALTCLYCLKKFKDINSKEEHIKEQHEGADALESEEDFPDEPIPDAPIPDAPIPDAPIPEN